MHLHHTTTHAEHIIFAAVTVTMIMVMMNDGGDDDGDEDADADDDDDDGDNDDDGDACTESNLQVRASKIFNQRAHIHALRYR